MPGSILLVEDNDDDAFFFEKAVQRLGVPLKVDRVPDGTAAVEYLMKEIEASTEGTIAKPSLVMLDLKLPRMGGFEVLEWIRSHEGLRHLWVSILSSSGEEVDRLRASHLKANAYLVKPISIEDYYVMVRQVWEQWLLPHTREGAQTKPEPTRAEPGQEERAQPSPQVKSPQG